MNASTNSRWSKWRRAAAMLTGLSMVGCTTLQPETDMRARRIEQAVVPMARAALAAGQVETARRLYTRLLDVAPDAVEARIGLGDVAMAAGRPSRAQTWYLDAASLAEGPSDRHAALLAHGRAAITAGNLDAAQESFDRLVDPEERASPTNAAWGHNGLAVVAMLEGDPFGTVAAVERAVLLDPDEQRFRENLTRAVAVADAYRTEFGVPDAEPEPAMLAQADEEPAESDETPVATDDQTLAAASETEPEAPAEPAPADIDVADFEPMPVEAPAEDADPIPDAPSVAEAPDVGMPDAEPEPSAPAEPMHGDIDVADSDPMPAEDVEPVADAPSVAEVPDFAEPPAGNEETSSLVAEESEGSAPRPGPDLAESLADIGFVVERGGVDYLQIGAFAVEANAHRLSERVTRLTDLPVRIEPTGQEPRTMHRVRIGPLPPDTELPRLREALAADATRSTSAGGTAAAS